MTRTLPPAPRPPCQQDPRVVKEDPLYAEPKRWAKVLVRLVILHEWRRELRELADAAKHDPDYSVLVGVLQQSPLGWTTNCCHRHAARSLLRLQLPRLRDHLAVAAMSGRHQSMVARLLQGLDDVTLTDPLVTLFEKLVEQTVLLYAPQLGPSVTFRYESHMVHPRGKTPDEDPYTVRACVELPVAPPVVRLRIYDFFIGPEAYASVLMLVTHELVAHVYGGSRETANDSLFSEGVMDWAAWYFCEQWATTIDPDLASAALEYGDRLARILRDDPRTKFARQTGHRIADNLVVWFERKLGEGQRDRARRLTAMLAVAVNTVNGSDRSLERKERLMTALGPPPDARIEGVLNDWMMQYLKVEAAIRPPTAAPLFDSLPPRPESEHERGRTR